MLRELGRTNPSFTVYWTGNVLICAGATLYLAVVASWIALLMLALCIFSVGVIAGAVFYGKGTLRNAIRALWHLMSGRAD